MGFETGWLARVTLDARNGPFQVINTLHYDYRGSLLERDASMQALADRLAGDLLTKYRALFNNGWTVQPLTVIEEKDPLNPDAVRQGFSSGVGGAGTRVQGAVDAIPLFSARIYTLKTGKIGRSFRGRMFMGGSAFESDVVGDFWGAPVASNFAFLADALVNAIPKAPDIILGPSTDSVHWVVYSPTRRGRDQDGYANDVTIIQPRQEIHSLRSRAQYS